MIIAVFENIMFDDLVHYHYLKPSRNFENNKKEEVEKKDKNKDSQLEINFEQDKYRDELSKLTKNELIEILIELEDKHSLYIEEANKREDWYKKIESENYDLLKKNSTLIENIKFLTKLIEDKNKETYSLRVKINNIFDIITN